MLTLETAVWCYWSYTGSSQGPSKKYNICTKYEIPDLHFLLICVPLSTTVLLFLQCLAFRFKIPWATHGSLDISFPWLFSEPFSLWTSFLVFSAGEFYPSMFCSGNWECPKSSSPSPPSHFFFSSNQCCNFTLYYSDRVHIFFQISNTNQLEIRKRKCALYFSIIETRVCPSSSTGTFR